jgi:hypothetical protein
MLSCVAGDASQLPPVPAASLFGDGGIRSGARTIASWLAKVRGPNMYLTLNSLGPSTENPAREKASFFLLLTGGRH